MMHSRVPMRIALSGVLTAMLILLSAGSPRAQEAVSAEIFEFGIYAPGPVTGVEAPSDYGVPRLYADHIVLLESTREIPASPNLSFGIRYRLQGGADGTVIPLTIIVRYPPQGLHNPEHPGPSDRDEQTILAALGGESFYTWDFYAPWHIEPGIWTIELWHDGEKLGEEWFEVISPPIS